jgi:hypothetical protein
VPTTPSVEGVVDSIAMSEIKMHTSDGRSLTVDTSGVDRQSVRGVTPGDTVTITGACERRSIRGAIGPGGSLTAAASLASRLLSPYWAGGEPCVYSEQ